MFNRKLSFSMNVRDPDNPEDRSGIGNMINLDGKLLIFKSSGIYQALTADTIDPQEKHPETRHSFEKIYSIGSNNSWVARMILQFKDILDLAIDDPILKNKLLNHVWHANKLLLNCESAYYSIYKETRALIARCDEIIESNKNGSSIPALPKVADLEKNVEHFLNNGKLFLCDAYELLSMFYGMPFTERTNTHFDSHRQWVEDNLGTGSMIYLLLDQDKEWVKVITESRNAIQHSQPGLNVEIENFRLKPGNKFSSPEWRHDLTKRGVAKKDDFSDLIIDFDVYLNNLLTFFEELMLLCIKDRLRTSSFLEIYRKTEEEISQECPIVYFVGRKQ